MLIQQPRNQTEFCCGLFWSAGCLLYDRY